MNWVKGGRAGIGRLRHWRTVSLPLAAGLVLAGCVQQRAETSPPARPRLEGRSGQSFYGATEVAAVNEATRAVQIALETQPSGAEYGWTMGGVGGVVEPLRTYKTRAGVYCRDYLERLLRPPNQRRRTACRSSAGEWLPVRPASDGLTGEK